MGILSIGNNIIAEVLLGGGSENVFIPTTKVDLENVANSGKIAHIESNIDLGGLAVTLADGITLYSSGGKLTNYGTITCSNTNFSADKIDRTIIDDSGTIEGTFNVDYIWAKWFGVIDTSDSALYDNFNALKNILTVGKDKVINVNSGHFYINVKELDLYGANYTRANLTLTGETHLIGQGKTQTKIESLPNDLLTKSAILVVRDAPNGSIENIWLKGDMDTATDIENEFRIALNIENKSHGFEVKNCRLSHASDGIESKYWTDFGLTTAIYEVGTIDGSGVDAVSTTEFRSQLIPISANSTEGYGFFNLGGFSGYDSMSDYSYKMVWYDDTDTYIGTTDWVYTYKPVSFPSNTAKYRTIINNPVGGVAPTGFMFSAGRPSMRVILSNNEIDHNRRNGMSNCHQEWVIKENYFHDNGGRIGGPGYGIGIEDGYQLLSDITIKDNLFENNFGGAITLRWVRDIRITGNTFLGNNTLIGSKSNINGRETWDCIIENNKMYSTDVTIGRYGKIKNNVFESSNINLANVYTVADGNVIYNGKIARAGDATTAYGTSISRNNQFIITRPNNQPILDQDIKSENDTVIYRNGITTGDGHFNRAAVNTSLTPDYLKGLKVIDAIPELPYIGLNVGSINLDDCEFSAFLYMRGGRNDDFTWKDSKFVDKVVLRNDTNVFTTGLKEWLIEGGSITSSTSGNVNSSSYNSVWNTYAVDVNITFRNFTFNLTDLTDGYLFNFLHTGTVLLDNCTIKADVAINCDMNRTILGSASLQCGVITFKDTNWINVTPTYRAGDVVITTSKTEVTQ